MTDNRIIGEFSSATEPTENEKNRLAGYFEKKLNRPVRTAAVARNTLFLPEKCPKLP